MELAKLRILHLLSNWKWTEISEPAVELALAQQSLGTDIEFVCGHDPIRGSKFGVEYHARLKGLGSLHVLDMPKHFNPLTFIKDIARVLPIVNRFKPDVFHCHMKNAHLIGFLSRIGSKPSVIVRGCYDPDGPSQDFRSRLLYRVGTDGLVVINDKSKRAAIEHNGFSTENVHVVEPGIDLNRFSPGREISEHRPGFGLKPDSFVIGVVSRIRGSRRLDIPLAAVHALAKAYPQLQLLLVGRGSDGAVEALVEKPAHDMDISDRIVRAGYCEGDRLVAAYRAMDVLIYPIPGSDKSCRTVREAMAAGLPVIAPGIGFLTELIENNVNGKLMDTAGERLATILEELILNKTKLHDLGRQAHKTAVQRFSPGLQARKTLAFYHQLLPRRAV